VEKAIVSFCGGSFLSAPASGFISSAYSINSLVWNPHPRTAVRPNAHFRRPFQYPIMPGMSDIIATTAACFSTADDQFGGV
jgi:hypothetical protein